jgi:hypothetical protein
VSPEDLDNRFSYHKPVDDQPARYEEIRARARDFAHEINRMCPDSREKSLAITALEEAVMWANASIARNELQRLPAAS